MFQGWICYFLAVWANMLKLGPMRPSATPVFRYVCGKPDWERLNTLTSVCVELNAFIHNIQKIHHHQERPLLCSVFHFQNENSELSPHCNLATWPFPFLLGKVICFIVGDQYFQYIAALALCCERKLVSQPSSHFFLSFLEWKKVLENRIFKKLHSYF